MEHVIRFENFSKRYTNFSIEDCNLKIPKGYITGIVGRNGAGKSTLIKSIIGAVRPSGGSVFVFDQKMDDREADLRNRIGIVPGGGHYYDNLTVRQNKRIFSSFYAAWDEDAFAAYLKRFAVPPEKKISALSTGMRVKLTIAFALSHGAELLLMDEPTAGLDPIVREELLDLLMTLMQDENKSVVFSTHITTDLDKIADYIILIDDGRVLLQEEKDALLERHALVQGAASDLTAAQREALIGFREDAYGFCALTEQIRLFADERFVLRRPTVEDMMLFYAGAGKQSARELPN